LVQADVAAAQSRPFNLYDEITYRCVALGFPLLTVGIILGGLWANEAWGNYWSWDPKESMSLVTLLGYGVYLHLRVNAEHSAKTLSWVSIIGFALMLLTYFGVNIMGVGLHSYGKIG
jgi:cytochrome c-type biogenesis protein CcsB